MSKRTENRLKRAISAELPATNAPLDEWAIARYADLLNERAQLRAALDVDGFILTEPVVSPRGDVVGERRVANPLLRELRQLDRALDSLGLQLGLSPAARARITGSKSSKTTAILAGRRR